MSQHWDCKLTVSGVWRRGKGIEGQPPESRIASGESVMRHIYCWNLSIHSQIFSWSFILVCDLNCLVCLLWKIHRPNKIIWKCKVLVHMGLIAVHDFYVWNPTLVWRNNCYGHYSVSKCSSYFMVRFCKIELKPDDTLLCQSCRYSINTSTCSTYLLTLSLSPLIDKYVVYFSGLSWIIYTALIRVSSGLLSQITSNMHKELRPSTSIMYVIMYVKNKYRPYWDFSVNIFHRCQVQFLPTETFCI